MPANIFLTGYPGSGKTTIIKKVLNELKLNPGGFMVGREGKPGLWTSFFLMEAEKYLVKGGAGGIEAEDDGARNIFAWRENGFSLWQIDSKVFDTSGVLMLKKGLRSQLVIMDELGRFESKAEKFQKEVEAILDYPVPVLGVIKNEQNPFLDRLRKHNDIIFFRVDEKNRAEIYKKVLQVVGELCH